VLILENVKNLTTHDKEKTFKIIKKELEEKGYILVYKVLNTAKITGIPQHRERIYVVGIRKDIYKSDKKQAQWKALLDFPTVPKKQLSDFFEPEFPAEKYYYTDRLKVWDLVQKSVVKTNTLYQYRRVYVRENKNNECPCLTANMGAGGHNVCLLKDGKGIRKLTPRECFNFQGFPSIFKLPNISDSALYKLAGNAVSVPIVQMIAERIIELL
jgi:DNA (cytosine-5)-methyltransferase 1